MNIQWHTTLALAAGMLAASGAARADLVYTYTSGEMERISSYLYGVPDEYGMPTAPGFSFSFAVKESWLSSSQPITLTLPASGASTVDQHFASAPAVAGSGNTVTINPDRSIAGWNFNLLLTESVPVPPFDPRITLGSVFGADTCNCSTFRYDTILYLDRGWGYVELGPAQVTYRSDSLPGNWSVATVSAVPEPQTYLMMLGGLAVMGSVTWRRRRQEGRIAGEALLPA